MFKEVKYNGYSSNPSDFQSADGDLSVTLNAIPEDGAIKRLEKPKVVFTLTDGKKVVYIHSVSVFENYIIYDAVSKTLQWIASDDTKQSAKDILSLSGKELYQVTAMGNTLVVLTSTGIIYSLYKSDSYQLMGNKPVFPSISFRLQVKGVYSELMKARFEKFTPTPTPGGGLYISNAARESVKNTVTGYFNPIASQIKTDGCFQYPFMVRYAYRMYDDTLSYISQPIKLYPSDGIPLTVRYAGEDTSNGQITAFNLQVFSVNSDLMYQINNLEEVKQSLAEWGELIKSIDIFVTQDMATIDENSIGSNGLTGFTGAISPWNCFLLFHGCYNQEKINGKYIYRRHDLKETVSSTESYFYIGSKTIIEDNGPMVFYHVSSIELKNLNSSEQKVEIAQGVLSTDTLVNREQLKGDSDIQEQLVAKYAYTYNARLNLTGVTTVPCSYPLESCFAYGNGEYDSETKQTVEKTYSYKAYILIEAEKRHVMVPCVSSMPMNIDTYNNFFFFPNVNATEFIVERISSTQEKTYSKRKLSKHKGLNGAYGWVNADFDDVVDMSIIQNTDIGIPYPNKIYTSEVNDPFTFPASLVSAVGSGEIVGISSAAKALSEGQFGQFPLYAFTSEGVWALEVSSTGGYSARQPITRDVCISSESITQIDTSVLFASDRGIMLLSGSQSTCISEVIDRNEPFSLIAFPKGKELIQLSGLPITDINIIPFRDFLKQSRMLYDYTHQHIIVYNRNCLYAYVFSLNTKHWGMMESNIDSGVNSYPESLAMDKASNLINYSEEGEADVVSILLSRPIKLDDPNGFKTIDTIIQRGYYTSGSVKQVLYGSNDYRHWFPIKSSINQYMRGFRGTPFKAFRIAIIANLDKYDSLVGCSISYTPRMTNRLR